MEETQRVRLRKEILLSFPQSSVILFLKNCIMLKNHNDIEYLSRSYFISSKMDADYKI